MATATESLTMRPVAILIMTGLLAGCSVSQSPRPGECDFAKANLQLRLDGFPSAPDRADLFLEEDPYVSFSCAAPQSLNRLRSAGTNHLAGDVWVTDWSELRLGFGDSHLRIGADFTARDGAHWSLVNGTGGLRFFVNGTEVHIERYAWGQGAFMTPYNHHVVGDLKGARIEIPVNSSWNNGIHLRVYHNVGIDPVSVRMTAPDGNLSLEAEVNRSSPQLVHEETGARLGTWLLELEAAGPDAHWTADISVSY